MSMLPVTRSFLLHDAAGPCSRVPRLPREWGSAVRRFVHAIARPTATLAGYATTDAATEQAVDDDQSDIQHALGGDDDAYERIIRRHQDRVAKQLWRFTRNAGTLEALVHDVFVEAWFALPGFRGDAPFAHYLARITTRVGYRHLRERYKQTADAPLDVIPEPASSNDDSLEVRDEHAQLRRAVEALPPRDRLVVTLLYLDEHSVAEAADLTGWSKSMVKVQALRARKKLRRLLERESSSP